MNTLHLNKVISIEDFKNPEIVKIIEDIFAFEIEDFPDEHKEIIPDSKQWESAMCVKSLRDYGALHRESVILGVGAGTEVLSFYLTKHVKQVFATDLYLGAGDWSDVAPLLMLLDPESYSPLAFEQNRLVVQHMDGRLLQYPENTFDGIFSSGSIEHFGGLSAVANASYEMGRVLKPGGILTLATEFKIKGPSDGNGWDVNTLIFSVEKIKKYIIEASGLELVDELDDNLTEKTLLSQRNLVSFLEGIKNGSGWENKKDNYPNLILLHQGYVFCSIHLALRKVDQYPLNDNSWACPNDDTKRSVSNLRENIAIDHFQRLNQKIETGRMASEQYSLPSNEKTFVMDDVYMIMHHHNYWHQLWLAYDQAVEINPLLRNNRILAFIYRTTGRIRKLGKIFEAQRLENESIIIALKKIVFAEDDFRKQIKDLYATISQQQEDILAMKKTISENKRKGRLIDK